MELVGTKWRTLVDGVRLGPRMYRVVRPARPMTASVCESWHGAEMEVDKASALGLATAWMLAARSPRSLVHLPLRAGRPAGERWLDLLLVHHSLAFPASRWKSVRARLGTGARGKVVFPEGGLPDDVDWTPSHWREHRDDLRGAVAAETLVITGSRKGFESTGHGLRLLAEEGPGDLARWPDLHCCAEIPVEKFGQLHVVFVR